MFTKESLESLRERVDLVEVLSSHIELKRSGAAYKGLCPFHEEKTPSFMIQKGDKHYHCFGCGAHGDAIQFLMTHQKFSFSDAVESLAQRFQVPLIKIDKTLDSQGPNKAALREALEEACRFFQFMLLNSPLGKDALNYLNSRDIDHNFIRLFRVGLAPHVGMLQEFLQKKSITSEIMVEAGLLQERQGKLRDFFSDRITFPVLDANGAVIGFSARKFKEETFGGKYINTPETALFKKSKILFGLHFCRKRIAKERQVIIVEGQIDALRLIEKGLNITVAGQGTAFGQAHAKELINLGVSQVYLALDGDQAGQEATYKIGDLFQKEGIEVQVVPLPIGMDPDAYVRKQGIQAFTDLLGKSQEYLPFAIGYQGKKLDISNPSGKNRLVQTLVQQIRSWNQEIMVHESLKKLAHLTSTPEEMLGVGQHYLPNTYIRKVASVGLQDINPNFILESDILRLLLLCGKSQPNLMKLVHLNLKLNDFKDPHCQRIYQKYLQTAESEGIQEILNFAIQLEQPEDQTALSEILERRINKDKAEESLIEALQKILNRNWMLQREEIRIQIQTGLCSEEQAIELLKDFDNLKSNPPRVIKI